MQHGVSMPLPHIEGLRQIPLTPCDPARRKYDTADIEQLAYDLNASTAVIMILAINLRHFRTTKQSPATVAHAQERAEYWARKSDYVDALREYERARSGAYVMKG